MKKFFALLVVMCAVLSCTAAFAAPIRLVYAEVNPLDSIVGQTATAFKQKVEELSGGSIVIDIQASGVLGSDAQILDGMLGGSDTVDMARISALALTSYGCQKATLLAIPYTFVSREHFWKFAASDLAAEFLAEPHEMGLPIRGICYGEEGFRHFFFKDPVAGLADLKGKKIRVTDDPVMVGTVNNLGANPTVVTYSELYSALQTGVTDAAEQPIANYRANAFHEVAPYLLLDGHTLGAVQIVIADTGWNKLNDEQRGWLMEAGKYAQEFNKNLSAGEEAKVLELLKKDGVHIIEVPDKAPWVEACQPTIKEFTSSQADLYKTIVDMQ